MGDPYAKPDPGHPGKAPDEPYAGDPLFDRVLALLEAVAAMDERMKRVEKLTVEIALGLGVNPNA
jgi:hypothetical protein